MSLKEILLSDADLQSLRDISGHDFFVSLCCKLIVKLISIVHTLKCTLLNCSTTLLLSSSFLVLLDFCIKSRGISEYFLMSLHLLLINEVCRLLDSPTTCRVDQALSGC